MKAVVNDRRFLSVADVADIMGISKSLAYSFIKSEDCKFAVVKVNSRILIPENAFYQWYDNFESKITQ